MNEILKRDQDRITVLGGVTDDSNQYITQLRVDPVTGRLQVSATLSSVVTIAVTTYFATGDGMTTSFTLPVTPQWYAVYVGTRMLSGAGNDYTVSGATFTFLTAPPLGASIQIDYTTGSNTGTFVDNEVLSGTVNGSNKVFTLANMPIIGSVHIYDEGGAKQLPGVGYTISGSTVTMTFAPIQAAPSADYRK
jgi:hypothetical protein